MRKLLVFILLITSCTSGEVVSTGPPQKAKTSQDLALEQYEKQEHRFRIEGCKLYYNDQQVILDPPTFIGLFGDNYVDYKGIDFFYQDFPIYMIGAAFEGDLYYVNRMGIKLTDSYRYEFNMSQGYPDLISEFDMGYHTIPELDGYVMIDGHLVDKNTKIEDLNALRYEESLPRFKPYMGNLAHQNIMYGSGYCEPDAWNYRPSYVTIINVIYNMSTIYKDLDYYPTTVRNVQYNYTNDTSFDEK